MYRGVPPAPRWAIGPRPESAGGTCRETASRGGCGGVDGGGAARRREPWFGKLFFTLSAPFIRHFERRTYVGNTWFAFSVTILAFLFKDPLLLSASVIGWTFGDPAAEIAGRLIPSKRFFDDEKSLAGALGCFVVSFTAYLGFFKIMGTGGDIVAASFIGALATTIAEMFSFSFTVNDNFMIPLATALALSFTLH